MKRYNGSFTIEAACVFPLVLFCICVAVWSGISLHEEVRLEAKRQEEKIPIDLVTYMYRRELVDEMFGEWYED